MTGSAELGRRALRKALTAREKLNIDPADPICIFDMTDRLGIEVRFRPEKSLDGMYVKGPRPVILISAHRPAGHQAFTCAHELGHHLFEHGTQIDEFVEGIEPFWHRAPEEWMANRFAASLLMPLPSVNRAFRRRSWSISTCSALQAYIIAGQLGVGYSTLITQMSRTLNLLAAPRAEELKRFTPKAIRNELLGSLASRRLLIIDRNWESKVAADVEVGDHILIPRGARLDNNHVTVISESQFGLTALAQKPGRLRVESSDHEWSTYIRIAPFQYVGRNMFRYLEESDADGNT